MTSTSSTPTATSSRSTGLKGQLIGIVVFAVLGWLAIVGFLRAFPPQVYTPTPETFSDYDHAPMQTRLEPEAVTAQLDRLIAFGSRFPGQPGFYATADYLRQQYTDAGLELLPQDLMTVVPTTDVARVTNVDGKDLKVAVHPFLPNHLQPMTTGTDGVRGRLVKINPEFLAKGKNFESSIAVIDLQDVFVPGYGTSWPKYAQLGFKAVIITNSGGLDQSLYGNASLAGMIAAIPANYVRLVADASILDHLGEEIVLDVRTRFTEVPNTNLVGILKGGKASGRAVIIPVAYDASSIIPDLSPGGSSALPVALQLQMLAALKTYQSELRRDVIFVATGTRAMSNDGTNRLLAAIGPYHNSAVRHRELLEEQEENTRQQKIAQTIFAAVQDPAFGSDPEITERAVNAFDKPTTKFFNEQVQYVFNSLVFELSEVKLQKKIIFDNDSDGDINNREFADYMLAKKRYDDAFLSAGYPLVKLLRQRPKMAVIFETRTHLNERFTEILAHHDMVTRQIAQDLALNVRFADYDDVVVLSPELCSFREPPHWLLDATAQGTDHDMPLPASVVQVGMERDAASGRLTAIVHGMAPRYNGNWELHAPMLTANNLLLTRLLAPGKSFVVTLAPNPSATRQPVALSFSMGSVDHSGTQPGGMKNLLESTIQKLDLLKWVTVPFYAKDQYKNLAPRIGNIPVQSTLWSTFMYPSFSLVNPGAPYASYFSSANRPFMRDLKPLRDPLRVLGDVMLNVAFGGGTFEQMKLSQKSINTIHGHVYVSGVGQSIIPNFPLQNAIVGPTLMPDAPLRTTGGYFPYMLLQTDVYGAYRYPYNANNLIESAYNIGLETASYDSTGLIAYIKDTGTSAQSLYKSSDLSTDSLVQGVNIVAFRSSPVTIIDMVNPQTLKPFTGVELIRDAGLSGFTSSNVFKDGANGTTTFVEPDQRFYVKLKAGSIENELVQKPRAFMLGTDLSDLLAAEDHGQIVAGSEIVGKGYLAARTPYLLNVPFETAKSMIDVNGKRLAVQNQGDFRMADERTVEFQEKGKELLVEASVADQPTKERILKARDAVTYAILNHPILRNNIFEAVWGIIWYLGLMVPFVFFFEKLVFGYSDIRKQLTAHVVIFLVVFALLKLLHPAFEMIRSSVMILLGFVIMLISGGITVLFSSKFNENLEDIRKNQGKVAAADVNRMGVLGTAFLLGLNNMHRRRVRTGLTCATLTLLTFVMICFTSVQNDLVDTRVAIGKAPYQGFQIKEERFASVSSETETALRAKYSSDEFRVVTRQFTVGEIEFQTREASNPKILATKFDATGKENIFIFSTALALDPEEPLLKNIKLLTHKPWFDIKPLPSAPRTAFLPFSAAQKLGITPEDVDTSEQKIRMGATEYIVQGIFDGESLTNLRDLDSQSLMPPDVESLRNPLSLGQNILADETEPRISGDNAIIVSSHQGMPTGQHSYSRIFSVALVIDSKVPYKDAKGIIDRYLEQSGRQAYFGLDGYSFRGQRARKSSFVGLVDMLIPLIIAALTVLNTMTGSVYERRDEIFVYNAVGIAPFYISMMFFAEAFVYATVGSVLGYILSQGTGRVLTAFDMTGGMNMTFTSSSTIYASMTIAISVFASTIYPAMNAKKIAATSDDSGWALPEPEGDTLRFRLPFTFTFEDRIAVLVFFRRYFLDHGEGSSGAFFAGKPELGIVDTVDPLATGVPSPEIRVPVWLKPFDLGVSQNISIRMVTDEETGEFIAEISIEHCSGTMENWKRLNMVFVKLVRKHFLHWRAVKVDERLQMFEDARALISSSTTTPSPSTSPATSTP